MLLAIDIGNTNITIGVFKRDSLEKHWRVSTGLERTSDEYGIILNGLLSSAGLKKADLRGSIICSVVPSANKAVTDALTGYIGVAPIMVGTDVSPGMPVLTDNPDEVGSDRIVNAVAAYALRRRALIVVDFGTAVTFDYITDDGKYAGGAIAPGVSISAEALFKRTAKLPRVEVKRPGRVVGRNTVESMQAGIFYGFVGLVDGVIDRIIEEVGTNPSVIATGGLAHLVAGESRHITETDEFLTLKGLKIIYEGMR